MSRPRFIGLLLALITLLVYLPVTHNSFLNYDDSEYVTGNRIVQNGLTWAGVKWAFTTWHAVNWHPITWLSHMTDCELFGLNPSAHHVVNVLFHTANVVLLLLLLFRLTAALWPSAFVAALFAWHPLHVESVAWIAERKDVLSTFFGLLTLLAYTRYVQKSEVRSQKPEMAGACFPASCFRPPASGFYWVALIFFALGLMSKPMLVTLPFVMLLLDYWPLQRFPNFKLEVKAVFRLALEKWPFFLLTVVSCVVTFLAQRHAEVVMTLQQFPLDLRLGHALLSYVLYLGKAIWPVNLAVLYPLSPEFPRFAAIASAAVLIFISIIAWLARKRSPCLPVGWLWFLGMLVPVIGLVQVGSAAMADRYTYFPLVGVFIAVTFAVRDLADRFQFPKTVVITAVAAILATCVMLTENQLRFWRDSESLFAHTLAVTTGDNPEARINYGVALAQKGLLAEALVQHREAARMLPHYDIVHYDIGDLLDKLGQPEKALPELLKAVQLNPDPPGSHIRLGTVLAELGRFDEAMNEFTHAAQLDPSNPLPHFFMGQALLKQGRDAEAIDQFHKALRLDPDNYQILAYTAHVLAANEKPEVRDGQTALVYAIKANVLSDGTLPFVLDALGMACAETGHFDDAQEVTQRAIDLATPAQMKKLEPLQQRLQLYKNHQPWRESFLATNTPSEKSPNN